MNATPAAASCSCQSNRTAPAIQNYARRFTQAIPRKWRGSILLLTAVLLSPVFIVVVVIDALTLEMPKVRAILSRTGDVLRSGLESVISLPPRLWARLRFPQVNRVETNLSAIELG